MRTTANASRSAANLLGRHHRMLDSPVHCAASSAPSGDVFPLRDCGPCCAGSLVRCCSNPAAAAAAPAGDCHHQHPACWDPLDRHSAAADDRPTSPTSLVHSPYSTVHDVGRCHRHLCLRALPHSHSPPEEDPVIQSPFEVKVLEELGRTQFFEDESRRASEETNVTSKRRRRSQESKRLLVEALRRTFKHASSPTTSPFQHGSTCRHRPTADQQPSPQRQQNRQMSLWGRVLLAKTRFARRWRNSPSREDLRRRYSRYPPDFHSFLYYGFKPLSWWGFVCGLFPLFLEKPAPQLETDKDPEMLTKSLAEDSSPPALKVVKLKFTWRCAHVAYCMLLLGYAAYLSVRTVMLYWDPTAECYEAFDDNLSISTPMTKFDRYVRASTETLGIPSALLTMICFACHFRSLEKFFNDWQRFETRIHYIASSMERFAKRARLMTFAVGSFVILSYTGLFSMRAIQGPERGCEKNLWDITCAIAKHLVRIFGAHFVDALFLYLTLSVASCFEALKEEILREFRAETGVNTSLLLRRIAQAKRTYLDLCHFSEAITDLFTPQLLITVTLLTYFCISTLYLAVVLGSFGGKMTEIAAYSFVFIEVTARIVACASAGHALGSKAEDIQHLLQHLNTVTWPREAQKHLESFIISTISIGAPEITASGFFTIRRPLCTAIFGQILTCFVILIEFRLM